MVRATEALLNLRPHQVRRTGWRLDGGFGTDHNINWLLPRTGQLVTKGYNATRAAAAAHRRDAAEWQLIGPDRWVALEPDGVRYGRRTQSLVLHWLSRPHQDHYALLIHTLLDWPMPAVVRFYDARPTGGPDPAGQDRPATHPAAQARLARARGVGGSQ
jgi:hypothetical protein